MSSVRWVTWTSLLVTKLDYETNSLDLEFYRKAGLPRGVCTESLQQHQTQGPETSCLLSPAVFQRSHGLNLSNSKVRESQEEAPVSDHPPVLPQTDLGTRNPCGADCQTVNQSQPASQSTFVNALLNTPKCFQGTHIFVAISALPRQMLDGWCEQV